MLLIAIYSLFVVVLDLVSLQFKLAFSIVHTVYRILRPPKEKSLKDENVVVSIYLCT